MQKPDLNGNAVHSQNVAVLTAAATLGTEVMLRSLGGDNVASTLEGEFLTEETIRDAIITRMAKFLG